MKLKKKKTTSQVPNSTLRFQGWTRYFRRRHSIKLSKNKMDSKVIKSHQCPLERCHAYLWNLILNSNQRVALFRKNRSLGLTETKLCKIRAKEISLFNYLMPRYISPIATSLPRRL